MSTTRDHFPTEIEGLPEARPPELVELSDGDRFDLRIAPVAKRLGDTTVRMLAYNGSIPGPTLKVQEGSELIVDIENQGDMEATVHWHGLRLENRYDGTHETQTPIQDGEVAPFSRAETTYAAMGRFGDVLLVNGQTDLSLDAKLGEVVRFYLTNTANTRVFKVALPGARMKLVGGDSGHVEHEEFVDDVVLAPSERVVIDVLFDQPGDLVLEHRTPDRIYPLAAIRVAGQRAEPSLAEQFEVPRTNADMVVERERIAPYLDAEPDKTVAFLAEMDMDAPVGDGPGAFVCPMHPEVVSEEAGHCPECGMKLLPAELVAEAGGGHHEGHDHAHATAGGIEWEDDMVEVNRMTTPANMRWKIIDRE